MSDLAYQIASETCYYLKVNFWGRLDATYAPATIGGAAAIRSSYEAEVSRRMQTRWANFATHGVPDGPADEPRWRPYDDDDRATLVIDKHDAVVDDLDGDIRTAWGDQVLNFR